MPTIDGQALPLGVRVCWPWEYNPIDWSYRNPQNGWAVSDEYLANSQLYVSNHQTVHFAVLNPINVLTRVNSSVTFDFPTGAEMVTNIDSQALWMNWNADATGGNAVYYHLNVGEIFKNWYSTNSSLVTATGSAAASINRFTYVVKPLTEEERLKQEERIREAEAAARQRAEEIRRKAIEEQAEKAAAAAKAKELLLAHLTPQQRRDYETLKHFEVVLPNGRRYRIERGIAGNIKRVDEKGAVERFCIHASYDIPEDDNVLAQKLLLEANEEEFRRIANITPIQRAV